MTGMSARPMTPEQVEARRTQNRAYSKAWYHRNKEKARAYAAEKRKANPEAHKASKRRWAANNPGKAKESGRRTKLKAYGITLEQYNAMFEAQGSVCKICGSASPRNRNGWSLDHCHATNRVRGILCHPCNVLLGLAGDSETTLLSAIEYLRNANV